MISKKSFNIKNISYYSLFAFIIFSGISISISQILLGITLLLFIIACVKQKSILSRTGLERYILPFIILSVILAFLSPEKIKNLLYIKDFWLISAFILAYFLHDSQEKIQKTFYLIVILVIFQSVVAFLQMYFNISFISGHNNIGIFNYNSVDESLKVRGGLLGMHLVFSCYLILIAMPVVFVSIFARNELGRKFKLLMITAVIMTVIILFYIRTRAIIIALPFAAVPLFFINKKLRVWAVSALLILSLIAGLVFAFYGQDQLASGNKGSIFTSVSNEQRIKIWKTAFEVWKKYPVAGTGGGNYLNEYKKVLNEHPEYNIGMITHAHNDYLNQLARKGIIGLLAFLYMLYGIFRYMLINIKYIKNKLNFGIYAGLFGAYCVFLTASLFQCFYTDDKNLVMFWFSIGFLGSIVKFEKKETQMHIPFHKPFTNNKEIKSVAKSIRSGWLTMGKSTYDFEKSFKDYIGVKHAIAVNSCTSALHLALKCTGIQPGDEVIVPAITHASTAEVVTYFNAKPVLLDVEKDSHLIDASLIEKKITKKTKAIIPVHYAGQPVDIDPIRQIAEKYNLFVIEDAAHAFPAKYKDSYIGTIGHATCFSFYATKTITTGEGGMVTTDNPEWAGRMRVLRLHGVTRDAWQRENDENFWEYDVVEPGLKYNTTDINSAMGIEQLKKADYMLKKRDEIALKYNKSFMNNEGLFPYIIKKDRESAWHIYPVKINPDYLTINRNKFINELKSRGIVASVHYIPVYCFTYYQKIGYDIKDFPASEWVFERTFSLPMYPGMSAKETDYVIDNVLDIVKKYKR